jgi:NAD(P)H-hydrate epimerase
MAICSSVKRTTILSSSFVRRVVTARNADSQKYDFGHVMVVAGSRGMMGAAVLCAHGALRCGAGLVTLAAPGEELSRIIPQLRPEVMTLALPEHKGAVVKAAVKTLEQYIVNRHVSSVVVGPGMGSSAHGEQFFKHLFSLITIAMVLDGDALTVIARSPVLQQALRTMKTPVVMTPHTGELSRLLHCSLSEIAKDRIHAAVECACQYRVICVLKGHNTVITDGKNVFINKTGNPGMATAGSGDVLAGMTGAFYAQVLKPQLLHASLTAVFLHGMAGDLAAKEKTQIAMTAGDIIDYLPRAIKKAMKE